MNRRWMQRLGVVAALVLSGAVASSGPSRQVGISYEKTEATSRKRALVIGNKAYRQRPLTNTAHDAQAVGAKLRTLGFQVTEAYDLDARGFSQTIEGYVSDLRRGDVSMVYYAGHGLQIDGENYLIPVDFQATRAEDVKWNSYALGRLMDGLAARELQVNVVVLDACRDNPFRATRSAGGGLASVNAGKGSLIAFATSPGSVADDGEPGKHGVFTESLLKHLDQPGKDIEDVFKEVRRDVATRTGERQVPWTSSSMIGQYVLAGGAVTSSAPVVAAAPAPASSPDVEPRSGLRFVAIAGGRFTMGCAPGDTECEPDEQTRTPVDVAPFELTAVEVTADAYQRCVDAGACAPASTHRPTCNFGRRGDHPINCVDWSQAQAFCRWAGARLPTAAEWEFAARSGGTRPWGDAPVTTARAQYDAAEGTSAVGTHPSGATPSGLQDMLGNVWEWTASDYPTGGKEARGGGWYYSAKHMRVSNRVRLSPSDKDAGVGFRCAR
ncbi:MAG: SUMF1/EgtB/PvdO family nonheme iron enzyme [Myxococcota bacterium]